VIINPAVTLALNVAVFVEASVNTISWMPFVPEAVRFIVPLTFSAFPVVMAVPPAMLTAFPVLTPVADTLSKLPVMVPLSDTE
jgi:hypothetical protein